MLQPWELEMGLIDSVLGSLLGGQNTSSPIGGILSNILQGGSSRGGFGPSGMGGGLGGGLGGLLQQFQQAGLGHVADSWVGTGPNTPVSPGQLRDVFGQDRVRDMASQSGMPEDDFLSQLSQHLPSAVDGMTPQGRLPDDNDSVSV
jgi:uncharacterized protein YidB (DUF937 family)